MWFRFLLILLVLYGAYDLWSERAQAQAPGILVAEAPRQRDVTGLAAFARDGYRITPLAEFEIKARVLSKTRYRLDREAELAPIDLALGWGPMSDSSVLDRIEISQSNRFFYWRVTEFPIPRREIERNAANMHLIPADAAVEAALKSVRAGQVVALTGYLVRVDASDGWHWKSSLRRDDTGNGACELIWVESARSL